MIITLALATATMIAPPIKVSVHAPADVRQQVVKIALREAAEIWMASGFAFAWNADAEGATEPPRLHVTFDDSPNRSRDYVKVLGWVQFDEGGVPQPQIHLSYTSAQILLRDAYGAELERYTMLERDVALGRALGRALAHELGHYFLNSKVHTPAGLMRANLSTPELFGPVRRAFALDQAQRALVLARWLCADNLTHQ